MNRIRLSRKPIAWLLVLSCLCIALTSSIASLRQPVVARAFGSRQMLPQLNRPQGQ